MNPIKDLRNEHQAVKLTLKILYKINQNIECSGKMTDTDHVDQLMDFFSVFVDTCHHGKEEDLLFPAMEKIEVEKIGIGKHDEFHKMLDQLEDTYLKDDEADFGPSETTCQLP
jgi:hemerythrin-like domain-containing protein